jgi:flavin-dependent dehydrogenase
LAEAARVAGAEVRQGVAAEGLVWHRGRVIGVRTRAGELRARVVVAADGLRSPLRRAAGLAHRGPRRRRVALVGAVAAPARRSGWGELVVLPDGVVGAVEVGPGRTNVVAVAHDDACDAVRGGAAAWFDRRRAALPHLAAAPRCGPLLASGPFDYPVRRVACPGLLLVGDAAGYFDPFTGQGLAHALADALAAAAALDIALRDPSAEAAAWRVYARRVRRRRARAHRWQRLVDLGVRRPPLLAAATAALAVAPPLTHFLWRQVADLAMVDAVTP